MATKHPPFLDEIISRLDSIEKHLESRIPMPPAYLNTREAARYLSLSCATLESWRLNNEGPRIRRAGRAVRYAVTDLDAFMQSLPTGSVGGGHE